ncbi:hypothetical protein GCK32_001991 [Trichostrongylus colubriformis]|uniref:Uncharacterized protein n=1 Tax=Trichostrongylus colubriformis TaxID=6319 RepID=A0AAN8IU95_TRICO
MSIVFKMRFANFFFQFEEALNLDDSESSLDNSLEGGVYTDDEDQRVQPNGRDAMPSERENVSPRVSSKADVSKEQKFRQMTIMDMARYMWQFNEVRNAIQDYDKELFAKMANIIFSDV